ncbi:3-oxoacyl-reductase [Exophiala viscosa]|uniref:3-oxoacyl-reductase n=1 Tax=Exophiala viscosa TaxID=2486360 RepID=A0AAN6E0P5_9EURO|nr:3-oxoacyl-reductase [Exophiala viscosa]KAI1624017.1 3-oxoacyl-reductase [Exophiala viscosa]
MSSPSTWLIVGASRGIGLEFVRQLLDQGHQVIAAVRNPATANQIWQLSAKQTRPGACLIEQCDVTDEASIDAFATRMGNLVSKGMRIENVVLNSGVLKYPNGYRNVQDKNHDAIVAFDPNVLTFVGIYRSFSDFALHLHTNTIGPILVAQKVLNISSSAPPAKMIFISSDSGSTAEFRDHEDGFGAYGASKAALNQMLRHMAAELKRKGGKWADVCVLAMHPGEVQTDMANIEVDWEVEGIIDADESVTKMLKVIGEKDKSQSGTFWCWDGREYPW